ncbi:alpha/beta hydrolase [Kribbella sp. NPDC055071]
MRIFRKRGLYAVLAVVLLSSGIVAEAAGSPSVPFLKWRACDDGFECATASVPLDYRKPQGTKIELALIRKRAIDQAHRIGSLFMNPGGPGGSGVDFVRTAPPPAFQLLSRFDVIGFDPRGVGSSKPTVNCGPSKPSSEPVRFVRPETADEQALVRAAKEEGQECLKHSGNLLAHISTANVARDLDLLRAAVGDKKLNYYGLSYGTVLGATYASMFPGKSRALLLDSAVDAQMYYDRPTDYGQEQAASFEDVLDRFFAACAAARCGFGGADPEAAFDALIRKLNRSPLPSGEPDHPAPVSGDEVLIAAGGALYGQDLWPAFADALVRISAGDPAGIVALDGFLTDATGSAVMAVDQQFSRKIADYAAATRHNYALFRHFWWSYGYDDLPAALWPVEDRDAFRGKIRNAGSAPILVIGGAYDPATPFVWSERLTADLGNARLLTFNSTGHGAVPSFNACVLDALTAYFDNLTLPPTGSTCIDDTEPFPAAQSRATVRPSWPVPLGLR